MPVKTIRAKSRKYNDLNQNLSIIVSGVGAKAIASA